MRDFTSVSLLTWAPVLCLILVLTSTAASEGSFQDDDDDSLDTNILPDRVARDFGTNGNSRGFSFQPAQDPRHRFIDWDAVFSNSPAEAKRNFGSFHRGFGSFPGMDSGKFQKWDDLFSREGRSFYAKGKPSFVSGGGRLGQDGLQNWSAFFERRGKRNV